MNERGDSATLDSSHKFRLSVFQEDWWLGIVRKTNSVGEVRVSQDNVVLGCLTYDRGARMGIRIGSVPWSHVTAPVLNQSLTQGQKEKVLKELIAGLPRGNSYVFVCEQNSPDRELIREAFRRARKFHERIQPTFVQRLDDKDVMERLTGRDKGNINSAVRALDIAEISADDFIKLYAANLKEADKKLYYPLSIARELITEGMVRNQILVYAARDKPAGSIVPAEERPFHTAVAFAIDDMGNPLQEKRIYAWMVTYGRKSHRAAVKLIFVAGMRYAQKHGLIFDADGAISERHIELYNKKMGIPHREERIQFVGLTRVARAYWTIRPFVPRFIPQLTRQLSAALKL
ncbi:MAG: hypothetical protein ACREDM_10665 [Methylocella sp.]